MLGGLLQGGVAIDSWLVQVPEVQADMQYLTGSSKQTPEAMAARARALERAGQWSGAIDAYLAITTQDTADLDFLEGVCLVCCEAQCCLIACCYD